MAIEATAILRNSASGRPLRERSRTLASPRYGDLRFRRLLADHEWAALSVAVRRRFSRRFAPGETVLYVGEVLQTRMTRAGRMLGTLARLIGAPLPHAPGGRSAAAVAVTENAGLGGQIWSRIYARAGRFPQVIHSTKRFGGPTGLEECVGAGVGMRLTVHVEAGALVFRSLRYFIEVFDCALPLPHWLSPGVMTVTHREVDSASFTYTLTIDHPWFGRILEQTAEFRDTDVVGAIA